MKYIVYDNMGEIVLYGESDFPQDHGMGSLLENADATNLSHYIVNGELVAYTVEQVAAKSALPVYPAIWSNTTFSWVDQRDLPAAQEEQWLQVKSDRDSVINGGVTWDGSVFDSDPISQGRIAGATTLAFMATVQGQAAAFSKTWKLADNSTRVLSAADMISVGIALAQLVQGAIDQGEAIRLQIYASTSLDQIRSLTWPAIS